MAGIEDCLPGQSRNALVRRAARQVKVMQYVREVEVAAVALQLRRERRGFESLLNAAMKREDVAAVATLHGCLHKTRDQLLRLAEVPNAPSSRKNGGKRVRPIMDASMPDFEPMLPEV